MTEDMQSQINHNYVMTMEELALYLKLPKSTLYKLLQEGRVPGQKLGKQWRFSKQAIDQWLNSENMPKEDK